MRLNIAGQKLILSALKALFWEEQKTLFIADPHFGKSASFRSKGIALPAGTTQETLLRLGQLEKQFKPEKLVVLGDLIHARDGKNEKTIQAFSHWRELNKNLKIILIKGNHDKYAGAIPEQWRISVLNEPWKTGPFICRHFPENDSVDFTLSGHIHPAIKLHWGKYTEKLPCFLIRKKQIILPAFGSFTGAGIVKKEKGDRIFVIADEEIIELKA